MAGPSASTASRGAAAALRRAVERFRAGRPDEAEALCRRVLEGAPRQPDALNLLGTIAAQRSEFDEAERLMREALRFAPDQAGYWNNLGVVLKKQGKLVDAVDAYRQAVARDPQRATAWANLSDALRSLPHDRLDPAIGRDLIECFSREDLPHQDLAHVALGLLRSGAAFQALARLVESEAAPAPAAFLDRALAALCQPLLLLVMERVLMPDPIVERILTRARRGLLDLVAADVGSKAGAKHLRLAAALARQCFLNEYVYALTEAEDAAVAGLRRDLEREARTDGALSRLRLMVYGCYAPLHGLANAPAIAAAARLAKDAAFLAVAGQQIVEPLEEAAIARGIPSLAAITDAVSAKVRAQYEDNPYPRWQSPGAHQPRPLPEVMVQLFPHLSHHRMPAAGAVEILIAGCGTGKHAITSARRFAGARVLAVDLSRASLAFAVRKARELGTVAIEFMQADILDLDRLGRSFDVIECVGVLHHMEDPERGLGTLAALLAPNGLIKIGLYSEIARHAHAAARKLVREHGYRATAEGIRAARAHILSLEADHPARALAGHADFYALSGCRDLILHAHERRFTLPAVAAMLDAAGLEFIGFEFRDSWMLAAYRERFPDDPDATSLGNWHRYECDHPSTFSSMYAFWARKHAPAA